MLNNKTENNILAEATDYQGQGKLNVKRGVVVLEEPALLCSAPAGGRV